MDEMGLMVILRQTILGAEEKADMLEATTGLWQVTVQFLYMGSNFTFPTAAIYFHYISLYRLQ